MIYHVTHKWDGGELQTAEQRLGETAAVEMFMRKWDCDDASFAQDHVTKIFFFRTLTEAQKFQADCDGEILEIDETYIELEIDDTESVPYPITRYPVPVSDIVRIL